MRVLSLFDGISCGRVALKRAGIPVRRYYASEIDKYAIKVALRNYPDTIELGDINAIDFKSLAGKIDLIIGGSPCQDLSVAKKKLEMMTGSVIDRKRAGTYAFMLGRSLRDLFNSFPTRYGALIAAEDLFPNKHPNGWRRQKSR